MTSSDLPRPAPGRRSSLAERRRRRTQEILSTTRALFDERGLRDAQIEDIAKAVGINKAIIYRHFHGKEELFALVLEGYLDELADRMAAAVESGTSPEHRLREVAGCFFDFGITYPAFADCALSLMRRTGPELLDEVSEEVMLRLGRAIARCLGHVTRVLREGADAGVFDVRDADVLANMLYAQGLGALQLARVGLVVKVDDAQTPAVATMSAHELRASMVESTLALVRAP